MSIQNSLSRWLAVQTLLGLAIVCLAVYGATGWSFSQKQQEEFQRHALIVRHVIEETFPHDRAALRHKLDDYFQSQNDANVALFTAKENIYSSRAADPSAEWHWFEGVIAGAMLDGKPLQMRLGINVERDQSQLRRLAWILFGAAVIGALIVSASGLILVRRALKPLQRLTEETAAAGPMNQGRIDAEKYDEELRPWIGQFNALLNRVDGAYTQLESFNADVAHELKTPLTNLVAQGEVALHRARSADEMRGVLASQLEDVRRLSSIVNDMLFLSRSDRGATARRTPPQSLAQQVLAVSEFMEAVLEETGLGVTIEGDADVSMDAGLIRRAISNLIGNAMRYAMAGSTLRVRIERDGLQVRLAVLNAGPAIDVDPPAKIFERFYRADQSRAGSSAHHGLGLAIVAAIARMHGGETFVQRERGHTAVGFVIEDTGLRT